MGSTTLRYNIEENESEFVLMAKEWLDVSEFNSNMEEITKVIDSDLNRKNKKFINSRDVKQEILNKIPGLLNYNHLVMDRYGTEIIENNVLIGYKLNDNEGVIVNKYVNEKGYECNSVVVTEMKNGTFDRKGINLLKWIDIKEGKTGTEEEGFVKK